MLNIALMLLGLSMSYHLSADPLKKEDCAKEPEVTNQVRKLASITDVPGGCAKPEKLAGICVDVYQNFHIDNHEHYLYDYEKHIHEAACADPFKDSPEVVNRKIQSMWLKLEDKFNCNAANFDVPRGSILKYAVKLENFEFLVTATAIWKVNLNKIDSSDNRTLLDYIQKEIKRTEGLKVSERLKDYYKVLRELGAKHRSELK